MAEGGEKRGVGFKAFGMSLVILSSLNMLLSWRGSFEMGLLHPLVMVAGVALLAFGYVRGR